MKLRINLLMMVAALFMAACSDDDNNQETNLAMEIAGKYEGYSVVDFQYITIPVTTPGEAITIVANEDGTCDISFPSVSGYGSYPTLSATVTSASNGYVISGSGTATISGMSGSITECDYTVEGTISSDKKTVSFAYSVDVMGGTTIDFTMGDAPANMVIAGVYSGTLGVTVLDSPIENVEGGDKVTIKTLENGTVELTLAGFTAMLPIGDITIADVEVSVENSVYSLSGDVNTQAGNYLVTGTFEGTIEDGEITIAYTIKPGSMPMDIIATFTGEK